GAEHDALLAVPVDDDVGGHSSIRKPLYVKAGRRSTDLLAGNGETSCELGGQGSAFSAPWMLHVEVSKLRLPTGSGYWANTRTPCWAPRFPGAASGSWSPCRPRRGTITPWSTTCSSRAWIACGSTAPTTTLRRCDRRGGVCCRGPSVRRGWRRRRSGCNGSP